MMGPSHRRFGAFCGASTAPFLPPIPTPAFRVVTVDFAASTLPVFAVAVICGVLAQITAGGQATSPDLDQSLAWRSLTGGSGWAAHRRITHWWGIPAVGVLAVALIPSPWRWAVLALVVGWASHLVGDWIFGEIPVDPKGRHRVGLGAKTDGWLEHVVMAPVAFLGLGYVLWAVLPDRFQAPFVFVAHTIWRSVVDRV